MNSRRQTPLSFDVFPPFSLALSRYTVEREKRACLITPLTSYPGVNPLAFDQFLYCVEQTLYTFLPQALVEALEVQGSPEEIHRELLAFSEALPLLEWNDPEEAPCTFSATFLGPEEYMQGAGRYLSDTLSKWLVPGKRLNISSVQALAFRFVAYPQRAFFFQQLFLDVVSQEDLTIIRQLRAALRNEIRTCTTAVRHARQIVTSKKLTSNQRRAVTASLASLLKSTSKRTAFDKMHHLLFGLQGEERCLQIKDTTLPFLEKGSTIFDRDIFDEIRHFVLLFGEDFASRHGLSYISRLISHLYLFQKALQHEGTTPSARLLNLKLLKTRLAHSYKKAQGNAILGVLGTLNAINKNELFEERHIMNAIDHCLPDVRCIEGSFVLDRQRHTSSLLFYIEIEKKDGAPFSLSEIKRLQGNLPHEIKESIESVVHPMFMPRNEEEIMRNILLLNQQIKYASDLPQVIISFGAQTQHEILFTVTLLRVLKEDTPPIATLFAKMGPSVVLKEIEVKKVGFLRNRYVKEANVFNVALGKKAFLRRDFSIDLFKARQALSEALEELFGGIRDFNGGMLSKQQEVFTELCTLLQEQSGHTFLLENFFYSLTPTVKQSLLSPQTLQVLFLLMQEALDETRKTAKQCIRSQSHERELFIVVCTASNALNDALLSLQRDDGDLARTHVYVYGIHCCGFLHQHPEGVERKRFEEKVIETARR